MAAKKKKQITLTNEKTGQTVTGNFGSGTTKAIQRKNTDLTASKAASGKGLTGSGKAGEKVPSGVGVSSGSGKAVAGKKKSTSSSSGTYKGIAGTSDLVYRGNAKPKAEKVPTWEIGRKPTPTLLTKKKR